MITNEVYNIEGTMCYVEYTGRTPGHEHYHGEITVRDSVYTFYGKTYRNGFYYRVHGQTFSARTIQKLARKCLTVTDKISL